jgi:hypothetical protein
MSTPQVGSGAESKLGPAPLPPGARLSPLPDSTHDNKLPTSALTPVPYTHTQAPPAAANRNPFERNSREGCLGSWGGPRCSHSHPAAHGATLASPGQPPTRTPLCKMQHTGRTIWGLAFILHKPEQRQHNGGLAGTRAAHDPNLRHASTHAHTHASAKVTWRTHARPHDAMGAARKGVKRCFRPQVSHSS